jgi:hypothetical protein
MSIPSFVPQYWNRDELYKDVWSRPLTALMSKYGVSAVAIGKTCRKLEVPLPGRGYWAKKANGHPVAQKPLPKVHEIRRIERYQRPPEPEPPAKPTPKPEFPVEPEDRADIEDINRMLMSGDFAVKKPRKALLHPLIVAARNMLRQGFVFKGIAQEPRDELCVDIRVSKGALSRALAIFASVIAVLEDHGMKIEVRWADQPYGGARSCETTARIFGERIRFGLTERIHRVRMLDPSAIPTPSGRPRYMYRYEPTGELSIHIHSDTKHFESSWHDREERKIESTIPEFVASLMKVGVEHRRRTAIKNQEQFFQNLRWKELGQLKAQIEAEEARIQRLQKNAENWHRAKQIREYVFARVEQMCEKGKPLGPKTALGRWAVWALQQADRIDPLRERPESIIDRKSELEGWSPYGSR